MNRHPVADAWDDWKANNPLLFAGKADGQYLDNRISAAFFAGWFAAEQCVTEALRCNARERSPPSPTGGARMNDRMPNSWHVVVLILLCTLWASVDILGAVPYWSERDMAMTDADPLVRAAEQWLQAEARSPYRLANDEQLIRDLAQEIRDLRASLAEVSEELEANRACNRFTWKDRACKSEAQLQAAEAHREALEAEIREAGSALAVLKATEARLEAEVRDLREANQHEKFKNQNLQASLALHEAPDKVTMSKDYCDELYLVLDADDTSDVVDLAQQLKDRADNAASHREAQITALREYGQHKERCDFNACRWCDHTRGVHGGLFHTGEGYRPICQDFQSKACTCGFSALSVHLTRQPENT